MKKGVRYTHVICVKFAVGDNLGVYQFITQESRC
jgi:hypothetical protein